MNRELDFCELWDLAIANLKQGNAIAYHPCCATWSTRGFKKLRQTHSQTHSWGSIIKALDPSIVDKKQALLSQLVGDKGYFKIIINRPCDYSSGLVFNPPTLADNKIDSSNLDGGFGPKMNGESANLPAWENGDEAREGRAASNLGFRPYRQSKEQVACNSRSLPVLTIPPSQEYTVLTKWPVPSQYL
jgi:hypothetical protein